MPKPKLTNDGATLLEDVELPVEVPFRPDQHVTLKFWRTREGWMLKSMDEGHTFGPTDFDGVVSEAENELFYLAFHGERRKA